MAIFYENDGVQGILCFLEGSRSLPEYRLLIANLGAARCLPLSSDRLASSCAGSPGARQKDRKGEILDTRIP